MIWAIMTGGEAYREPVLRAALGPGAAAPEMFGKGDEGVM
jgi:hypothetical protein